MNSVAAIQNIKPEKGKLASDAMSGLTFALVMPDPERIGQLILPAIAIGIISILQGAGVSQTFPNPDGKFSDISRDFFGQGATNLAAGLFGGIPAGGSSSGSALALGEHLCRNFRRCHCFAVFKPGGAGRHAGSGRAGLGEENIFLATQTFGESGNTVLQAAREWLKQGSQKVS